jgi:RimJ/RimL family protein N-acetyltransferase
MITPARTAAERMTLVAYMASKIGVTPAQMIGDVPFEVVGVHKGARLVGAVLYLNRRRHSIEMSWAGESGWLTPGDVRRIWSYPFRQLGCLTVMGTIHKDNAKSRALAERMGCDLIGIVPHAFGEGVDGALYCMRRENCRWLSPNIETNEVSHVG